jgi:hypothetical protein
MAPENELDDIDIDTPEGPAKLREAYERQKARGDKADALIRENAALRLGIDVESRLGQAWLAGTKVDLNDKEAALADAKDFSPNLVVEAPAAAAPAAASSAAPGSEAASIESSGSQQRQSLADGATPSSAVVGDPVQDALARAEAEIRSGTSREVAQGGFINALAKGVNEGTVAPLNRDGTKGRPAQ